MEIGSLDLLDDPILLEEIEDDVLTSVLPELVSLEELLLRCFTEIWVEGKGAVEMLTLADLDAFVSGKFFLGLAVSEISVT